MVIPEIEDSIMCSEVPDKLIKLTVPINRLNIIRQVGQNLFVYRVWVFQIHQLKFVDNRFPVIIRKVNIFLWIKYSQRWQTFRIRSAALRHLFRLELILFVPKKNYDFFVGKSNIAIEFREFYVILVPIEHLP